MFVGMYNNNISTILTICRIHYTPHKNELCNFFHCMSVFVHQRPVKHIRLLCFTAQMNWHQTAWHLVQTVSCLVLPLCLLLEGQISVSQETEVRSSLCWLTLNARCPPSSLIPNSHITVSVVRCYLLPSSSSWQLFLLWPCFFFCTFINSWQCLVLSVSLCEITKANHLGLF